MAAPKSKALLMEMYRTICVGSLTTSLHVVFPLIKCLNKLGSVNLVTEDKAFLTLSPTFAEDYELGNTRIRIVECISLMAEEELKIEDYNFTVLDVREYLPCFRVDKYLILSARDFFRQQLVDPELRQTQTFSVYCSQYQKAKDIEAEKSNVFVNEKFFNLGTFAKYDKMVYQLMTRQNFKAIISNDLVTFLCSVLEGHSGITKSNVISYLKEVEFL